MAAYDATASAVRREPAGDAAAGSHLDLVAARPPARWPAGADRLLGLLRGRLPEADRGRGRLPALRPHQPVGPPARHADGRARPGVPPPTATARRTPRGRARPAWWWPPTRTRSGARWPRARTCGRNSPKRALCACVIPLSAGTVQTSDRHHPRERVSASRGREAWEPPGPQPSERTLRDPLTVDPGRHRPNARGVSRRGFLGYVDGGLDAGGRRRPGPRAAPARRRRARPRRRSPRLYDLKDLLTDAALPTAQPDHGHRQQGRHRVLRAARARRSARASPPRRR